MDRQTIPPLPWSFHYQIYDAEWTPMQLLEPYLFALTGFQKKIIIIEESGNSKLKRVWLMARSFKEES